MSRPITTIAGGTILFSSLALGQLLQPQSKTVEVNDPRPVARAVQMLEGIYGWPITYEDPITVNESQLEDVTERVRSDPEPSNDPDPRHRVIVQKGGTLSFTYKLPSSGASTKAERRQAQAEAEFAVADALSSVLDGYATSGGPLTFTVVEEDRIFHVIPTNFLNRDGKLQPMMPILDTRITILPKQRTRQALLNEVCQSLTQSTGVSVGEGVIPYGVRAMEVQTTISGSGLTARSILNELLAELAAPVSQDVLIHGPEGQREPHNMVVQGSTGPLSWRLLYGPGFGYALNIHQVIAASK